MKLFFESENFMLESSIKDDKYLFILFFLVFFKLLNLTRMWPIIFIIHPNYKF
jgi:hypothetical protein